MKEKYITKRKRNGHIIYEVTFKYFDKETKTFSKSFNSRDYNTPKEALEDAIKERDKARLELAQNRLKRSNHTLAEVYEEAKELIPLSFQTDRRHDTFFNNYIKKYDRPITKITSKHITLSLTSALSTSQDNINRLFSVWKRIFKCALINDYVSVNPCDKVIVPKSEKISRPKNQRLEVSIGEIIDCIKNYRTDPQISKLIIYSILICYFTGLRPSECYALTKEDVLDGYIYVNKAVGSLHNVKRAIKHTKTYNSIRKVPIPQELQPVIDELCKRDTKYFFERENGELFNSDFVSTLIHNACKKRGIEFRMYMLRHNFSTSLIQSGVDIRTIQELMGHTSAAMSVEYARSNDELKKKAVENIGFTDKFTDF